MSENWEYAEEFFFPVTDIDKDKLTITLVDFDGKISVSSVARKVFKVAKAIVSEEKEEGANTLPYHRGSHPTIGEEVLNVDELVGKKQKLRLFSPLGGLHTCTFAAQLFYLDQRN